MQEKIENNELASGDRHYWFARPEDYAVSALIYDKNHSLNKQTQRPAFEVIFVYSESERSLDIRANGSKDTILDLQTLVGTRHSGM